MHGLGELDRFAQLARRVVQHAADAPQHPIDRTSAELDSVALAEQLDDLLAREPADPGQHRDMRVQPRPERAQRHARRQLRQRRLAAIGALEPQPPPLAHLRHDHRQLPLLMADWIADAFLAAGELAPAPTPPRHTVKRPGGQLLRLGRRPAGTLMTRLPALTARFAPLALQLLLRALPRQLTALLSRQRRIRRRRHRTVARGAVHLPLKLLEPLLQPSHLVQRIKQPDNQRPCRLPTSHRDRFRLDPIHDRRIRSIQKESCSPPRHHLLERQLAWGGDAAALALATQEARARASTDPLGERVIAVPDLEIWSFRRRG